MKDNNIFITPVRLIQLLACFLCFFSCDDFLEKPPSRTSNLEITTAEQLEALLNTYSIFNEENNNTFIYSTDDYELPVALFDAKPSNFGLKGIQYYTWDVDNVAGYRDNFWEGEYKKIFYANVILENLDNVSGLVEDKDRIGKEAYYIRAYSYFELVNTYCMPYSNANLQSLGLPLKRHSNYEESLDRNTLENTYNFIEEDIKRALLLKAPLVKESRAEAWRANKAAVNALAARFYLSKQEYQKALDFADEAIENHPGLANYSTDMYYGVSDQYTLNPGTPEQETFTVEYPYTHDNQSDVTDRLYWKEFMYFRTLYNPDFWYIPSQDLLSLFDQANDLRYQYHVVEGYSFNRGLTNPSFEYPGYIFFFKSHLPSGPTIAEMYLVKAECQARLSDAVASMATLNTLYQNRTKPATPALTASTADEALTVVLEERRREMPFTKRWQDIRRYNNNNIAIDDVEITRTFYPYTPTGVLADQPLKTYTLTKDAKRYAAPIPQSEIEPSQGEMKQNPY